MYKPKQLSDFWVVTKNGETLTNKELGRDNHFNFESEAWQAIEDYPPQFTTIIVAKTGKLK